jgi:hypothetical protein
MGGIGSGRRWQFGADTTDSYRSIDVRWLKRKGMLADGRNGNLTWSRNGQVTGSINVRAELGRVFLNYRHREHGGEWKAEDYPVHLCTTACHMGGERQWFRCPARGCGRRIAILYGGAIFACRHCHRLAYPSQREEAEDRATRRADRIRDRLEWPGGVLEGGGWGKPKGMHWRTYEKLCQEHDQLSKRALAGIEEHLAHLSGRF